MRKTALTKALLCIAGLFFTSCYTETKTPSFPELDLEAVPLLPLPVSVKAAPGSFGLDSLVRLSVSNRIPGSKNLSDQLSRLLYESTGWKLQAGEAPVRNKLLFWQPAPIDRRIELRLDRDLSTANPEGYELHAYPDSIILLGTSENGLLRGMQTLKQLVPHQPNNTLADHPIYLIPTGSIVDYPNWEYRGMMLDVARHFFEAGEVRKLIDQLAFYKMNRLHLHLSDDQGWRLEIKKWPRLTDIGGASEVGGTPGGFYTQEEFRELVNYAADRGIELIPEFDMPGHTQAAVASYPELNGTLRPPKIYTGTRVGFSSLDTRNEFTYRFVGDLFDEVGPLLPARIVHIGGDESEATSKVDYLYFLNRVRELADDRKLRIMGWGDISVARVDSTSIVQHWLYWKPEHAYRAFEKGARVVLSPANKAYLDMKYNEQSRFGLNWAGYITLDSVYAWNPEEEFPENRSLILGIEAPLWSETISNPDEMEYLAFPRLLAYAELGWTPRSHRDFDSFTSRLLGMQPFLEQDGIDFYRSPAVDWK